MIANIALLIYKPNTCNMYDVLCVYESYLPLLYLVLNRYVYHLLSFTVYE